MNIVSLTWINRVDFPGTGGCIYDPEWDAISEKLDLVLESSGSVGLDAEDEAEQSRSLQVRVESGNFLLTMGVETENGWNVRGYENPEVSVPGEMVTILGEQWNLRKICRDKETVKAIFWEFFESGDVSIRYLA